ncbi:hypothetical protein [Polaromonas sp. JS666]|uniref:hypothetical protein n=1 Tax=Polaromonas sp. (strain JS666 / ATCC BAA-500) TaxID=296591 RepID=UPI000053428A|nr:hypothetical protein [Polaromonas sp. JS666]ABE47213.1 hypothetical protein Bpro_5357 [Polaromonas sp. JS666]
MKIQNALAALMLEDVLFFHLLKAIREKYGVHQLGDLPHFTFCAFGDEILLTEVLRAKLEAALGASLQQVTGIKPYTTLINLVLPQGVSKEVDAALLAFETANPCT